MKVLVNIFPDPETGEGRDTLLMTCLREFLTLETNLPKMEKNPVVCRSEKGKPYFKEAPWKEIDFSISHSDGLWSCVMGRGQLGIDIQKKRPCRHEAIAKKHFYKEEGQYVSQHGLDGFYEIWTRREALAKYTGLGFFGMAEERPCLTTKEGHLKEMVLWQGKWVRFEKLDMEDSFEGVWCREEEG